MTNLITEEYLELLKELHQRRKTFGVFGGKTQLPKRLEKFLDTYKPQSIIDYGCGKGVLVEILSKEYENCIGYDPAHDKFSEIPTTPADVLISTDVLEHIEPDLLDNVLQHIDTLFTKAAYLFIATSPASKELADGRNAHLIVEDEHWWKSKIEKNISGKITFHHADYKQAFSPKKNKMVPTNRYTVIVEKQ